MHSNYNPMQTSGMPLAEKLKNMIWEIVYVMLFRFSPAKTAMFRKWRVFLLRLFGARISYKVSIHPSAKIDYPWRLTMGDYSSLGEHSWAYCFNEISIGEKTCIGNDVYILTGSHDITSLTFGVVTKPVRIGNGVWVATGSYILPGVTLADMTVVAAKSCVSKSTDEYDVVGGNPAKFIKKREFSV